MAQRMSYSDFISSSKAKGSKKNRTTVPGETTVGREEDRDITIADPTVSAQHAAIDVVDVPGGGGEKRITVKDLHSTNGTFVIDTDTAGKTRLVPRKAIMVPENGCHIYFGAVFCKLAMGRAPDPSAEENDVEAKEAGLYDVDTQLPGAILDEDNRKVTVNEGDKQERMMNFTEPLAHEEEEKDSTKKPAAESGAKGPYGARTEAEQKSLTAEDNIDEDTEDEVDTQKDIVEVEDIEEPRDDVRDKVISPEGAVSDREHERELEGTIFGRIGSVETSDDNELVEDGGVYELPTQAMSMELDDTLEESDEIKQEIDGSGEMPVQNRDEASAASATEYGAATVVTTEVDTASGGNRSGCVDEGDDTADEGETARLFEEDNEMSHASAGAPEAVRGLYQEVARGATSTTYDATPLTPLRPTTRDPAPNHQTVSPGGASDASTQRQEMHEESSNSGQAGGQEQAVETTNRIAHSSGAMKENPNDNNYTSEKVSIRETKIVDGGKMDKEDELGSDEDDASDASGALIPAQDLEDFEKDDLVNMVPDKGRNALEMGSRHTNSGDGDGDANCADGVDAPEEEEADDSGTETDGTEIDTDDGPANLPERDRAGEEMSPARSASIDRTTEVLQDTVPSQETGESVNAEEVRSPGGSLLRRTTTKDAMEAIAREQQRTQTARAVVTAAREGADAMYCESREIQVTGKADGDDDEPETQAVPMSEDEKEALEEARSETGVEGTEVVEEAESPDVLGDDITVSLPIDWNSEQSVVAPNDPVASAIEAKSSSREKGGVKAAEGGAHNAIVSHLTHARGTTRSSTESAESEIIVTAEVCEVPAPTANEDVENLEGREQAKGDGAPVHEDGKNNDDNNTNTGGTEGGQGFAIEAESSSREKGAVKAAEGGAHNAIVSDLTHARGTTGSSTESAEGEPMVTAEVCEVPAPTANEDAENLEGREQAKGDGTPVHEDGKNNDDNNTNTGEREGGQGSAIEAESSSREKGAVKAAEGGAHNTIVSDFTHAQGTTRSSTESAESEPMVTAEICEVPAPTANENVENLEGREQAKGDGTPVHEDGKNNDDNNTNTGETEGGQGSTIEAESSSREKGAVKAAEGGAHNTIVSHLTHARGTTRSSTESAESEPMVTAEVCEVPAPTANENVENLEGREQTKEDGTPVHEDGKNNDDNNTNTGETEGGQGSAIEAESSSREKGAVKAAEGGAHNAIVSDFTHARGTTRSNTESAESEPIMTAEVCEVPAPTANEDVENLEGREQAKGDGTPVHEDGKNNDDNNTNKGEREGGQGKQGLEVQKRVEEVTPRVRRGTRAPLVDPRTSGRRRKKPKAFDEINDDSASNTELISKGDVKVHKGTKPQRAAAAQEAVDATPRRGRTRSARSGATPQTSRKSAKYTPSPIATSRKNRGTKETADNDKCEDAHDGTNARRGQKQPDRTTRGSIKRRRSETTSGTLDSAAPTTEPETPKSVRDTSKRSRRSATKSSREENAERLENVCAGPHGAGFRGRARRGSQRSLENKRETDAIDGEVKGKGKGKANVERKRAVEGSDIKISGKKRKNDSKKRVNLKDDSTLLTPKTPPPSGRRDKKIGANAVYTSFEASPASSRRGIGRLAMTQEKSALPSSPRVSSRNKPVPMATLSAERVGGEAPVNVKVCFTNIKPTSKERSCMKKLGISEVENVLEATHLVAGGRGVPLKRTPKLLAGIGRCRFVVDVEWLYQSSKESKVLEGLEYILCDAEAEKKWGFNMRSSLCRRPDNGILAGFSIYVDPAVAGTKGMGCPPLDEMKMVVTSAGGIWLAQLPKRGGPDPHSLLVITHPDALAAPMSKRSKSSPVKAAGRDLRTFLPETLFLGILRQRMSWPDSLTVKGGQGDESSFVQTATPAKRRRACK